MEREILRIVLPSHPLLGRNVNHDSESRRYRVSVPRKVDWHSVRHPSTIPILDQGSLGACTGNSGVAAIYRDPFAWAGVDTVWPFAPTQAGAVDLYSAATQVDPFQGTYPPDDTGSDGLSIAKVLKARGIISGYLWAFTLEEALVQLMRTPVITGVPWLNSMFETTGEGHAGHVVIQAASGSAGGHELCVDELVVGSKPDRSDWWVGGPNSWGVGWGDGGRWYWTVPEWGWLLSQSGDVTAFVPRSKPAPEPEPVAADPAGDALWAEVRNWARAPQAYPEASAAAAVRTWAEATGRASRIR